jgi:hypothetical protein
MCDSTEEVTRIQGLIETAEERERFLLTFPSLPSDTGNVTRDSLIAELEAKVKHYRERVEDARYKLRVWESALKSALEERGEGRTEKTAAQEAKGKADRAFVREVLKRNAKTGVTPKQIREAAAQQRLSYSGNFPHTTLHKLKTQSEPEVREEGGRYFPILPA